MATVIIDSRNYIIDQTQEIERTVLSTSFSNILLSPASPLKHTVLTLQLKRPEIRALLERNLIDDKALLQAAKIGDLPTVQLLLPHLPPDPNTAHVLNQALEYPLLRAYSKPQSQEDLHLLHILLEALNKIPFLPLCGISSHNSVSASLLLESRSK